MVADQNTSPCARRGPAYPSTSRSASSSRAWRTSSSSRVGDLLTYAGTVHINTLYTYLSALLHQLAAWFCGDGPLKRLSLSLSFCFCLQTTKRESRSLASPQLGAHAGLARIVSAVCTTHQPPSFWLRSVLLATTQRDVLEALPSTNS